MQIIEKRGTPINPCHSVGGERRRDSYVSAGRKVIARIVPFPVGRRERGKHNQRGGERRGEETYNTRSLSFLLIGEKLSL